MHPAPVLGRCRARTRGLRRLISTPWQWVWFDSFATLVCGVVLGWISAKPAAVLTPRPRAAAEAARGEAGPGRCGSLGGLRAPGVLRRRLGARW